MHAKKADDKQSDQQVEGSNGERGTWGGTGVQSDEPQANTTQTEEIKDRVWDISHNLSTSIRYTGRLEAHFTRLDRLTMFANLAGGSAVVANLLNKSPLIFEIAGITVLSASLLSTTFKWAENGRKYALQKLEYATLKAQLERLGKSVTHDDLDRLTAEITLLEGSETSIRLALLTICENEQITAEKSDARYKTKLWFYQRWFAAFVSLPPANWEHGPVIDAPEDDQESSPANSST